MICSCSHLGHDILLKVYIIRECHPAGVDTEDPPLSLLIRKRELDLPVNPSRPDESGVEGLDPVGGHDDLHITSGVEAVQLVEELQHCPLDLPLAPAVALVPLSAHSVDLVDEDDAGRVFLGYTEELSDQLGAVTEVLLDQLTANLGRN